MPEGSSDIEPVVAQIPTEELKRILTDRFARQVAAETGRRIWRPVTLFGLPGIVLAFTLVWQLLDSAVTNKISAQLQDRQRIMEQTLNSTMTTLFSARTEVSRLEARDSINEAFQSQRGTALGQALRSATESQEFQQDLSRIVNNALSGAWRQESPRLRDNFLQELSRDEKFREVFARDVELALASAQSVPRIIAGSLEESLLRRRPEDGGQGVALALLASMDQTKANDVVRALLERSRTGGYREVALGALAAVSFAGLGPDRRAPSQMLTSALDVWSEHCADARCGPDQPVAEAMAAFLRRGRELGQVDRDAWITALQLWHEAMIASPDARAREVSLGLVPRALAEIGSPEATAVLTRWAVSTDSDLALSTTQAIGALQAEALPDRERLTLMRTLWTRVTEGEGTRAAVIEAAWMALGQISRGAADSGVGSYTAEAAQARAYLAGQDRQGALATWATASQLEAVIRRGAASRPPRAPCTIGADMVPGPEDVSERPGRLRADLCALAALLRPKAGAAEWSRLRPPLLQRDRVALLGLLWALSVDGTSESAGLSPEARFAPLHDLMLSSQPAPPGMQLAALLVLRTVPDRQAWQVLDGLVDQAASPAGYLAATRWAHRAGNDEWSWFAERLRAQPEARRAQVLDVILGAMVPSAEDAPGAALGRVVAAMRRSQTTGMVNALMLAHAVEPAVVQEAAERAGLLQVLLRLAEGQGRTTVPRQAAHRLHQILLTGTGWHGVWDALAAVPPVDALPAELVPAHAGRFGRLRLEEGSLVTLQAPVGARGVMLFHAATHQTRLLQPGETWHVLSGEGGAPDRWMYRIEQGSAGLRLAATAPRTLELGDADAPSLPVLDPAVIYRIHSLGRGAEGWALISDVRAGDRLRISTVGLERNVDTTVTLVRGGTVLGEDDDGGQGWESLLRWTADRTGPVQLRLRNIGAAGGFYVMVTRED